MSNQPPKVAVVTGAGSGIGAAVAHALAGDGWVVVLAGRRPQALASVAERGAELAGVLDPAPTDVTDEASVRALFNRTVGGTAASTCCSITPAPALGPVTWTPCPWPSGTPWSRSTSRARSSAPGRRSG